jgi:hypothetical protein
MEQRINRVNDAIRSWDQSEKEHGVLHPKSVGTPASARTRLRALEIIQASFRNTKDPAEQISLLFLKDETSRLRAEALKSKYNWRYIVNFLLKRFTVNRVATKINRLEEKNNENFLQSLRTSGFGQFVNEIKELIKQGKKDFTFTAPFQNNVKEATDFKLNIGYDPKDGHSFNNYQAQYVNKMNPGEIRQHTFSVIADGHNPQEIMSLMAGKAIYDSVNGWKQLDLTDKDARGNYKLSTTNSADFDLEKNCEGLPFWNKLTPSEQAGAILKMQSGRDAPVTFTHIGAKHKVYLEAFPLKQQIATVDERGKSVNINKIFEAKSALKTSQTTMKLVKSPSLTEKRGQQKAENSTQQQEVKHRIKLRSNKFIR